MPFCANCGAAVEGNFCPSCGKPVAGAASASPAGSAGGPSGPAGAGASSGPAAMPDNLAGTLCYLLGLITGILFLVLEPYNRNRGIRFHAFQSIFLNIAAVAIAIAFSILGTAMHLVIPILGAVLLGLASMVIWLGYLVLWIVLMVKTYGGGKIVLPVIGPLAEKQAG